jgi:hypothetical protein
MVVEMQRVLDLDLDFFVEGFPAHWRPFDADRLDVLEHPPWPTDLAIEFLMEKCRLDGKLPGFAVEHHGELFMLWRDAIERGVMTPPFHVTHVDAHADLGLGEYGYAYLMTDLLFEPPDRRRHPPLGNEGLTDGNWLSFAVACRWISRLTYVFNRDGEAGDIHPYLMEGFDPHAAHLELAAMHRSELDKLLSGSTTQAVVHHREPKVPFDAVPWREFEARSTSSV